MLFGQLGLLVGGKGEVKKQYWKNKRQYSEPGDVDYPKIYKVLDI